jgi:hypothetical protein
MGGWNETCLTKLAAWMNGWNQVLVGVETDEQEEKTESLSELELPDEVEYWGKGSSQVGGE